MAIKTIEYNVNLNGITPSTEQFAGTQGDHKVTVIEFALSDELYESMCAVAESGNVRYRFDLYDGEGGLWQSEVKPLSRTLSLELEERHTRFGGKITVYLVITVLSKNDETEVELYSFPATLKLKNRPSGMQQNGENYDSVTSLSESAKTSANRALETLENTQRFAFEIEQKLKNGEFDGVGIEDVKIVDGEMIIFYTDNTFKNLGNVKGDKGDKGDTGAQGEKGKDAVIDKYYNADSTNAQSGKAVAEAIADAGKNYVSRVFHSNPVDLVYIASVGGEQNTIEVEEPILYASGQIKFANQLPRRNHNGNLYTYIPIEDLDCTNKKYVDDIVGDIDSALDELHNYAQAIIGGGE